MKTKLFIISLALYSCGSNNECSADKLNNALNRKLEIQDSLIQVENQMLKDFDFYLDMNTASGEQIYLDSAKQIDFKIKSLKPTWESLSKKAENDYRKIESECLK
jgi:hypothetical protein